MRTQKIAKHRNDSYMAAVHCPFVAGLRSLGSLGGDNGLFKEYLGGNDMSALRKDWEVIGSDMRKVMNFRGNEKLFCLPCLPWRNVAIADLFRLLITS